MHNKIRTSGDKKFLNGYVDDPRMAGPNHLTSPSVNVDITKTGEAVYSPGFIPAGFDLSNPGKTGKPFHVARYNVTFFAQNGALVFYNHNNNTLIDTGLALSSTIGSKSSIGEYAGDIYVTNTENGLYQIHMGLVNDASANSGDATFTVDQDLAGRLNAFGDTSGSILFATTSPFTESYTGVSAAGLVTLTNTLDATVPDNTVIFTVENISSGRPKASGLTFWKERMVLWGVIYDTAVDSATNLLYMSSFASLTDLENIIDFNSANTAALEMVGKNGVITDVLSTRDYLYVFTQNETYYASVADINVTTGGCPPQILSNQYGCIQQGCSVDVGNGLCLFLTNNKRIIGIKISSESGAPVVFPDESFDRPISNIVALLDSDQSDSFFFHAPNDHRCYMHVNVDGERTVLKYNTEIQKFEPPRTGWNFGGMFVKDGITYATERTDDDVWQLGVGYQNNGQDYEKVIATSLIEGDDGRTTLRLESVAISGRASELSTVTVENYCGEGSPQQKTFTVPSGASSGALGSVILGSATLGTGMGTEMISYDKLFGIYPTYASSYQLVVRSLEPVTLSSYSVYGVPLGRPLLTLQ